jgi:cell division protein FtsI (penicillin-binding protein 3)
LLFKITAFNKVDVKRDILWRVYLGFLGIVVLSLLILGRAIYIQKVEGKHWRSMSDSLHQKFITLNAERGAIYSEDGQMLSVSIPTFDVYMDFKAEGLREKNGKPFFENLDSFSLSLATFFQDKTAGQYKKDLQAAYKKHDRYYLLHKKMSFEEYKQFRNFPLVRLGRNKSGIIVEVNTKRETPFGLLANRVIGLAREFKDVDNKSKKQNVGLEKSYDTVLSGKDGQKMVRFLAGGVAVPLEGLETDPINGKDIYTTIDVNIQDITETALLRMMQQCEGPYGTAIVMETTTGKIKAMANLGRRPDGSYWEDDNYALRATEPGSTIKLATLLSVLDKGTSTINDMVEVGGAGRLQVGSKMVTDAERSPKAVMTVKECFAHSSNVGMSKLALKAFGKKPDEIKEYLHRYKLDERSPIDLTNVPKPTTAPLNLKGSAEGNMLWMSFGYGLQVSPLHTLTLYNAVANNGKMMRPYLVNSIMDNGVEIKKFEPTVMTDNFCKASVIKDARAAMEQVVIDGTARRPFKDMPFAVAGKTGTAHVSDGPIKYEHGVYQATFVGYFPANKPKYTCIVLIRTKPHAASHFGGTLAAPVFREIATKLYAMYVDKKDAAMPYQKQKDSTAYFYTGFTKDIQQVYSQLHIKYTDSTKQQQWASVQADNYKPVVKPVVIQKQVMPNVKGMGLKDALYVLETMGVRVNVKGKGKVQAQSLPAGALVAKGITVMIELN